MAEVGRQGIEEAYARIRKRVRRTPTLTADAHVGGTEVALSLKLEQLQHTGSFKPRGAFHALLARRVPAAGVVAASGGNHGAAVAFAARALGHQAEIFVPAVTPATKLARIRGYGARVVQVQGTYADALATSERRAQESGAATVHAYDQIEVVAGQGTVALELEHQAPDLDVVLVAVGGGGLLAGIAAWYGDRLRVVGVEPAGCPTLAHALEAGKPVDVKVGGVAVDSLGARRLGVIPFAVARRHHVESVLVTDDAIRGAQRALWEEWRLVAEPGGAAPYAALASGGYRLRAGERVGVVISGANADPAQAVGAPRP